MPWLFSSFCLLSRSLRFVILPSISDCRACWVIAENDASLRPLRRQFGPKSFQLRRLHHRSRRRSRSQTKTSSFYRPTCWQWQPTSLIFGCSVDRPQSFSLISRSLGLSLGGAAAVVWKWAINVSCIFVIVIHPQLLRPRLSSSSPKPRNDATIAVNFGIDRRGGFFTIFALPSSSGDSPRCGR